MDAERMKRARERTGYSYLEIKEGMELSSSDDPIFGAAYYHASNLNVFILKDRHQWNTGWAQGYMARNNLTECD